MLKPDLHVASVTDVTLDWLRSRQIQGVLVDADDTIVTRQEGPVDPAFVTWLRGLRDAGLRVAVLSNGNRQRVVALGAELGLPAFALSGKPLRIAFRRGVKALGTTPATTAMVGDQLFTDVLGAKWAGLVSVLVTPLTPGRHAHTRAARRLERWVLSGGDRGRPVDR